LKKGKKKILSSVGNVLELITQLYLYHLKEEKPTEGVNVTGKLKGFEELIEFDGEESFKTNL
jgi:hypothetical protein